MKNILLIVNIVICALLVFFIFIQGKGAGLGSAWGGSGELYQTRRGMEKITLRFTVILIGVFLVISVLNLFLSK